MLPNILLAANVAKAPAMAPTTKGWRRVNQPSNNPGANMENASMGANSEEAVGEFAPESTIQSIKVVENFWASTSTNVAMTIKTAEWIQVFFKG